MERHFSLIFGCARYTPYARLRSTDKCISHYLFLHIYGTPYIVLPLRQKKKKIQIRKSFKVLDFMLCYFMWHLSHFHKSNCIFNTFMQSTPNIACCFSEKVLWNLLQKHARFTIHIYPNFGFVLVNSFFIHPHKKYLLNTRSASCGPLCWTLSTESSTKMKWLSKSNFPTLLGYEYHPLCFTGDTALEN